MKKLLFLATISFFLFPTLCWADTDIHVESKVEVHTSTQTESYSRTINTSSNGYVIENFHSEIEVNQDTSLTVTETIQVNFPENKHGIFRPIPVIYSAGGRTIKAKLKLLSVTNENGQSSPYSTSRSGQSLKIKIGDPNQTLTGQHTYVIKYQIDDVLLRYPDHDEVYWNVTGPEWDTIIYNTSATVNSPFASITKVDCFAGQFGSQEKLCQAEFADQKAHFVATENLGQNKDLTLVIALDKNNQLQFPGPIENAADFILDNWGYPVALIPLLTILYFWYQHGRDRRYLSDNIYYQPENKAAKTVSLFERKYLPTVYSPIDNLTPAQVGTIIDEKVDIQDIVAEIVELARLGYLEIKKIEKEGLFKKDDYLFIKVNKDPAPLKDYQKYLLEKLFLDQNQVKLSKLKNKFYQYLNEFKNKLYQNLSDAAIFDGRPDKTRLKWLGLAAALIALFAALPVLGFAATSGNPGPIFLIVISILPTLLLANSMPRRRAWGYSLYRQIEGLRYYLNLGQWREEIHEKHLFFEEILPLAISLGVVDKLAKDMAVLEIEPPNYLVGFTANTFARDFVSFNSSLNSSLLSSPQSSSWSSHSSWSGGSGFSGGSSGGGFGGGGGGSW